ncbi:hypothetical protein FQN60_002721, partial [Etheostoma spectabile]
MRHIVPGEWSAPTISTDLDKDWIGSGLHSHRRLVDGVGTGGPWLPVSAASGAAEREAEHRAAGETPVIRPSSAAPGELDKRNTNLNIKKKEKKNPKPVTWSRVALGKGGGAARASGRDQSFNSSVTPLKLM